MALKRLEDLGYFCVDNLPPDLIPKFAEICLKGKRDKAAAAVDMRMGDMFSGVFAAIDKLEKHAGNFAGHPVFRRGR